MAEFNSCAKLKEHFNQGLSKHKDLLEDKVDPFTEMYEMQLQLQEELHKRLPQNNPDPKKLEKIGEIFEWIRDQKQSIDDEYRELIDALPGMSMNEKDRSAIWKKWKSKYSEIREHKLSELSEDDMLELKFEFVDIMHFILNIMISLKLSPKEVFALYFAKNAENFRRYKNNY